MFTANYQKDYSENGLQPERITTKNFHYNLHSEFKKAYFPSHKGYFNNFRIKIINYFTLP